MFTWSAVMCSMSLDAIQRIGPMAASLHKLLISEPEYPEIDHSNGLYIRLQQHYTKVDGGLQNISGITKSSKEDVH